MTRPRHDYHARAPRGGSFFCVHCGFPVPATAPGTQHRNHCPHCLWSRHVDLRPGDRRCACHGAMEPITIWFRGGGEGALIHRCARCGTLASNRLAGDDDLAVLLDLASGLVANTEIIPRGKAS